MTTVGQVNQELKVVAQQNEGTQVQGSNVDAQLREAFSSDQPQGNQLTKPLKAQDLNFEGFPKGNRLDASEFAGRSLNEVKDAAREFNADFPETPYVVDYSEFPKPEAFSKKNYGGKEEAYNAWKDAVTEWVEDCKQDMVTRKSNHIGSMTEKFERAMNNGFFNIYLQMGMTRDFIQATYEALHGDINKVKAQLDAKAEEIKQHTTRVGNNVARNVNANTNRQAAATRSHISDIGAQLYDHANILAEGINTHIDDATSSINANIDVESFHTRQTVRHHAARIQGAITEDGNETRGEMQRLQSDIMAKLEKMPTKKSLVIDFIKGSLRLPIDSTAAGFNFAGYLLSLPAEALKKISDFLGD